MSKNNTKGKQKVLSQLDNIHNVLCDKQNIIPYGHTTIFIWAVISAILFLGFEPTSNISLTYAMVGIVLISLLGLAWSRYESKKENTKYDLFTLTHSQKFIYINNALFVGLGIVLSYIFVKYQIGYFCYPIWVFLIGFLILNIGFIINNKQFKIIAFSNILISILLLLSLIINFSHHILSYLSIVSALITSGSLIYLGFVIKNHKN